MAMRDQRCWYHPRYAATRIFRHIPFARRRSTLVQTDPASPSAHHRIVRSPGHDDLEFARRAVGRHLVPTPLVRSDACWLKLETLQPTGSFKVRGAIAALSAAPDGARIVAASAGNHALGIAFASETLGIPATVVIAETASPAKRAYLEQRPVTLIRYGQSVVEAEAFAIDLVANADGPAHYVSPYNDTLVIAGQSTVLDEIVAELPDRPLRIVVPVGGGGLLAGIALRAAELVETGSDIEIVGVESSESMAVSASVAAGQTIDVAIGETIADGLSGNIEPCSVTVSIIREHAVKLIHASERDIRETVRWLIQRHGLVAEGAGVAAIVAIRADPSLTADRETVAIVSGKNISQQMLVDILTENTSTSQGNNRS
jgi:threonine dehydratase